MVSVAIPGHGPLRIENLVLDYNGADTFGKARSQLRRLDCELTILGDRSQDRAKAAFVRRIGAERTACIGNGRNDTLMLRTAALGIAVIQAEGAAVGAVLEADLVVKNVLDALDLLLHPLRLVAGLRT